jgi:SAM-dependent methyltransferase
VTSQTEWSHVAAAYDRSFATLCSGTAGPLMEAVLEALDDPEAVRRTPRLLDVGCGTGLVAQVALERGFTVIAADPDDGMRSLTTARLGNRASVVSAGLPRLPFADGEFEATLANFVVNHVDDPRASVSELARVTAPGHPVAITIWPQHGSTSAALFAEVIERSGAVQPETSSLPPDRDFDRDVSGLSALLDAAGITRTTGHEIDVPWRIRPEDLWLGVTGGVAGIGRIWSAQPPDVRARMRAAYGDVVPAYLQGGLLSLPSRAVLCVGLAPA